MVLAPLPCDPGPQRQGHPADRIGVAEFCGAWPVACSYLNRHSGNPLAAAPSTSVAAARMYGLPPRRTKPPATGALRPRVGLLCTLMRACTALLLLAGLIGCRSETGQDPRPGPESNQEAAAQSPGRPGGPSRGKPKPAPQDQPRVLLDHDFGIVPHGERRQHEFEVKLADLGEPFVPLRVHLQCACGRAHLVYRQTNGTERIVDTSGSQRNLPVDGERLMLKVELDTAQREALDLEKTTSRGYILLQPLDDPLGTQRIRWPFVIRFGVDAPVDVRPFTALAFGRVAESQTAERLTTLRGDATHAAMTFDDVRCSDPSLEVSLEPGEDCIILRARCTPGELGNHRALVSVGTSLPGYRVQLPASWKVVPDLEATPMPKVAIQADLSKPQEAAAAVRQFVLVTDHDNRRSPEFLVRKIASDDGRDLSQHIAVEFVKIPGQPRQQRMTVRYLGGLRESVRGTIVLAKPGPGLELPVDLVVFSR